LPERHAQSFQCQGRFQAALQRPTDAAPGEGVQQDCQINKLQLQADVGDIGDPDLIDAVQGQAID